MQQFWSYGYRATSVDDLVKATGLKPGSLYSVFPGGKHDVLLGTLEHYTALVIPAMLGDLEQPGASLAELRAFFDDRVRDMLADEGCRGCLIANSAIELAAQDDEVATIVRAHYARMVRCFETALRNARAQGEISASIVPARTGATLFATCLGLMVISKAKPAPEVLYAIVDTAFGSLVGPAASNS
jgi:TetR/AcrR family transcriptional repressor of nem operon